MYRRLCVVSAGAALNRKLPIHSVQRTRASARVADFYRSAETK